MAWDGPILTDSGGFQVFSLEERRKLDDDGVTFRSHLDGSEHRFTPENVIAFQEAIGVDIAMVLDVCVKLPATREELEESVRLTTALGASVRARRVRIRSDGRLRASCKAAWIETLRERSARELVELDFPGYAIGGLSVGETREEMYGMARACGGVAAARTSRAT